MKPDWKDAPAWANWMAMDEDGEWYWHEFVPEIASTFWKLPEAEGGAVMGRWELAAEGNDWRGSLEARP